MIPEKNPNQSVDSFHSEVPDNGSWIFHFRRARERVMGFCMRFGDLAIWRFRSRQRVMGFFVLFGDLAIWRFVVGDLEPDNGSWVSSCDFVIWRFGDLAIWRFRARQRVIGFFVRFWDLAI